MRSAGMSGIAPLSEGKRTYVEGCLKADFDPHRTCHAQRICSLSSVLGSNCADRGRSMRRREFISLGGAVVAWPLSARAQQPGVPVIGFLSSGGERAFAPMVAGFVRGLKES